MTFDEFINKYLGTKVDWDNAYQGQCVDLFRQYVNDCLTGNQPKGVEGAADFWSNYETDPNLNQYFDKIPNTPTGVPAKGDVVLWNRRAGGGYGHVAMFIDGDVNSFLSLDQNWPTLSVVTKTQHNYTNVYGWLHPKEQQVSNELEVCLADREKFWKERDEARAEVESLTTRAAGLQARATDLGNQLGTAQAEVKNLNEQTSRLKERVITMESETESLRIALKEAQNATDRMAQDRGALQIEVEQLRTQLETAKQGEFSITIGDFIKLLLKQSIKVKRS